MKYRNIKYMITLLTFIIFVTGCTGSINSKKGFKEENKISVVTTVYPIYDFTKNIAGENAEIINLVPAGMEPHDFELSTGDMQLIEEADIFIYNGAGMEHFVDKTLQSISNKDLMIVECAKDIELLNATHSHEEGEIHEKESHNEENMDPHTWLSISNAIKEAEVIKEAFVKADEEHAKYYEDNYQAYKEELTQLQNLYKSELSDLSSNTIVVAHEAFGYLCEEYNLTQLGIEGLTADSEPDSARMKEIIDFCREYEVKVIFFEELVSPKVAESIASEVGAQTMVLNPIEGLTAEQIADEKDYISIMHDNLEALKKALQ